MVRYQARREEEGGPGEGVKRLGFTFRMHTLPVLVTDLRCIAAFFPFGPLGKAAKCAQLHNPPTKRLFASHSRESETENRFTEPGAHPSCLVEATHLRFEHAHDVTHSARMSCCRL